MKIIGQMWTRGEEDILEEVVIDCLPKIDSLFIGVSPEDKKSWEIVESLKKRYPDKIEHIQKESERYDRAQRTSLLNKIQKRYDYRDTWVQVIESDVFLLDTDIREAIKNHAIKDLAVSWQMLNGVRHPGTWTQEDKFPNWDKPIREVLNYAHLMEVLLYTFRPMPRLYYSNTWRPYPSGFSRYASGQIKTHKKFKDSPLLFHVGWRGPTHTFNKMQGRKINKYPKWDFSSRESTEKTMGFYNGDWNNPGLLFEPSRKGWIWWLRERRI